MHGLASLLRTRWLGHAHEHHETIASTNDRAAAWAREGAPHGALVTADAQTRGRGRLGRAWDSPPGAGIYATAILRPPIADARLGALGLACAVGLRRGLATFTDALALKWPNDVLCHGRKLAGILCEARWIGGAPEIAVGFGINVDVRAFPPELADVAIALAECMPDTPARDAVLASVLAGLEGALDSFFARGFVAVRREYEGACASLGTHVVVNDGRGGELARGFAQALDDDGALLVRDDAGTLRRVMLGDVSFTIRST